MGIAPPVKVAILLFVLGTASSAVGLLAVAGTFKAPAYSAIVTILCILLAAVFVFFALYQQNSQLTNTVLWLLAIFEVAVAIAAPVIPFHFHDDAGYVNRAVVYALLLIAMISGLAVMWQFVTGPLVGETLELAGVDKGHETLLYLFWGIVESFIAAWFLPLKQTYQREVMFKSAVNYTVGFFFVGGVLAAALGVLLVLKGRGAGTSATPPAKAAEYDSIG
jgi:hypothetical protein